jgi:hypothetical protein
MYYKNIILDNKFFKIKIKYGHNFDLSNGPLFVNQNDQSNGL